MARFQNSLWAAALAASFAAVAVSGFQFQVGGKERGWKVPTGDEPETYDEWASRNRFRVGDTLRFKYARDSVLAVKEPDYAGCNASNPTAKFEDGDTVFKFGRSGPFYFISGQPGHCKLGQRLTVTVIHPSDAGDQAPAQAPATAPAGSVGESAADTPNTSKSSTGKLAVVSYAATAFAGLSVLFI